MLKPRFRKLLLVLSGVLYALIALISIAIVLAPTVAQFAFKHWLEQQHLHSDIAHFGIALNTGTVTVLDAVIRDGKSPLFRLHKLQLHIKLRDLLDHKITLDHVVVEGTRLRLQQHNNELVIAGIRIKQNGPTPPPTATQKQAVSPAWSIHFHDLHITGLDTCLSTNQTSQPLHVCTHVGELRWTGELRLLTDQPDMLKVGGNLFIGNLEIVDAGQKLSLLKFDSLALTNIAISGLDQMKAATLELRQLTMLPNRNAAARNAATLALGKLQLNAIALSHLNDIAVASINIEDISSYIRLQADNSVASLGEIAGYLPVATGQSETKTKSKVSAAAQNRFHIKVGKIAVTSAKPIILEDGHIKPAASHRIEHMALALGPIDSARPAQASALSLQFKYGKYGTVKASGKVRVFAPRPSLDLNARIVGLNLNRVSPYTRELLQHKIKSGQLNARLVVKIDQGKLDSTAKLTLYKFYVSKLSAKETDKYQKDLGIPLSAALSLLRDKHDNIRIELPVTGDVENPDFSLNDIIATVSAKAIKVAIVNYYATLGLIKIVSGAFDLMTALRFAPVAFQTGQTVLTDTARTELDKFATMLKNRPQVHLVVCGHATKPDQLSLFPAKGKTSETTAENAKPAPLTQDQLQQLNRLATARGERVKQYLVEKKGVAADRLIPCNPEYKAGDEHVPYVELHI